MDGYGSSHPYPYGYPPPSQVYPPQPPPNSDGYPAHPPVPYPYPYAVPYQYPYPQPAYPYPYPYAQPGYPTPPSIALSYSGPVPQTSAAPPTLQHSSSFQHGSQPYYYPALGMYPPQTARPHLPTRSESFSGVTDQGNDENSFNNRPSNVSAHKPLDNLMADMRLSDNRPSVPASPSASSMPVDDELALVYKGSRGEYSRQGSLYETHSRSPSWDACFSCRGGFSSPPAQSLQLVPHQAGSFKVLLLGIKLAKLRNK